MIVTLELAPELETTVKAQAASEGVTLEQYLPTLIAFAAPLKAQPAVPTPGGMIALLRSWRNTEDPDEITEQHETFAYLQQVVDRDRLEQRRALGPQNVNQEDHGSWKIRTKIE